MPEKQVSTQKIADGRAKLLKTYEIHPGRLDRRAFPVAAVDDQESVASSPCGSGERWTEG